MVPLATCVLRDRLRVFINKLNTEGTVFMKPAVSLEKIGLVIAGENRLKIDFAFF